MTRNCSAMYRSDSDAPGARVISGCSSMVRVLGLLGPAEFICNRTESLRDSSNSMGAHYRRCFALRIFNYQQKVHTRLGVLDFRRS